jgi:hypothetical protein
VDHGEACGSRHGVRGRRWTAADSDLCRRRRWLGERRLPASLAGDLGCNRALEGEESTMVLLVSSDGEGGGWWWCSLANRDDRQQGRVRVSRARRSTSEGGKEAMCEKGFSIRPRAAFIGGENRRAATNRQRWQPWCPLSEGVGAV